MRIVYYNFVHCLFLMFAFLSAEAEEEGTGVAEVVEAAEARTASENKLQGEFHFLYENQIA